ncbi:Nif11-like leader peptide family natural product precursor [Desulfovibrio sp. JC010]|uniref:Nif11-like leader peptide family natural product precursor n=1 Tax=Desulfovibrio sp. JC010 TaxID=2593641 RepID=UPI0013D3BEAF|nr:Nif11-like leader peptide family natural product precursor [Desulfovibrio sp. JC010]NDV28072.1 Nif11-like leader peptide family natural product precursor [Desulfovibrio sp. JC010]
MSVENARAFIEKVKSDGSFSAQINNAESKEARVQIAREAGLEFTEQEYLEVTSQLPAWTMDDWLAARRAYDSYETSWLAGEFNPWRIDLK